MARLATSTKRFLCLLLMTTLIFQPPLLLLPPYCGMEIHRKVYHPTFGRGKGAPGFSRRKYARKCCLDVYNYFKERNNDRIFESHTRMYIDEFEVLIKDLKYLRSNEKLSKVGIKLSFEDKILLVFFWIVKYLDYALISHIFSTTPAVVTSLLETILPLLVEHFVKFIPNAINSELTSKLSSKIVAIIDSTIHATKKPSKNQHLHYNENYKRHGMMTTLLLNFDHYISCFVTGGLGRMHDAAAAKHMNCFIKILKGRYALGDPGYEGVPYVVSGFKSNQLISNERIKFDRVSRSEQIAIEHVNNFIKSCRVLSKRHQFIHSRDKHIACVYSLWVV